VTLVTEVFDTDAVAGLGDGPVVRRVSGEAAMPLSISRALKRARGEGVAPELILEDGWLMEPLAAPDREVWIWGAGHVGRAIVDVLAPLPDMAITWVDTAPERFPDTVPSGVTAVPAAEPAALVPHAPRDAEHMILTFSHELDLALCHALLSHGFRSCGLIGSATKWARFRKRLAALGHAPGDIARIVCPIGAPSLGKHPQAIAIGVASSLLAGTAAASRREDRSA
jgi:xanthine dehydrogenase accessory factor